MSQLRGLTAQGIIEILEPIAIESGYREIVDFCIVFRITLTEGIRKYLRTKCTKIIIDPVEMTERHELDGKLHREGNLPAGIRRYSDGKVKRMIYKIHGILNRTDGAAVIEYNYNGQIIYKAYYRNGLLTKRIAAKHYADGIPYRRIEYYNNDKLHRTDGPAVIVYRSDDIRIHYEEYYENGKHHRTDGAAAIYYHNNGSKKKEFYYINGKLDRLDGPAWVEYNDDGNVKYAAHYRNGLCTKYTLTKYRADGTKLLEEIGNDGNDNKYIIIKYGSDGITKWRIEYYESGSLNRADGPAITVYSSDGCGIEHEEYWRNGILHRTDGPTVIGYNYNGAVSYKKYYKNEALFFPEKVVSFAPLIPFPRK